MAQFTNQATLTYNGITTSSNVVTGEITQVINMWKDATVSTYQTGDIITYVVSLQNFGTTDFTGLTLTDNLGAYTVGTQTVVPLTYTGDPVLYYQNGVLQTTPTVTAGPPLVIPNIGVLAGTSTIIIYRARLNEFSPLGAGGQIVNTATVTGDGLSDDLTATETITANNATNLMIMKALAPSTIVENGQITYTFTIQNTGAEATQATGVLIADNFDPILSNISATLNGTTWTQAGNYTYNATTGAFATVAGQITVPAATYTQNPTTGVWTLVPGVTILQVTGTV
jgi:uncharacterized repeat protein (TIGR01451 family)